MIKTEIDSFFFTTKRGRLFVTAFGELTGASECLVYLAPLFEERMWAQRVAFNFAQIYWKEFGLPILFVDYYGYGESDGDTEDFSLSGFLSDLEELLEFVKDERRVQAFNLWGIRTGSALAIQLCQHVADVKSLMLWAPELDLKKHVYDQLRFTIVAHGVLFKSEKAESEPTEKMTRDIILKELLEIGRCERGGKVLNNVDGYRVGQAFWKEIVDGQNPNVENVSSGIPVLSLKVAVPKRSGKPPAMTNEEDRNGNVLAKTIATRAFWKEGLDYSQTVEELYSASLDWIREGNKVT